MPTDLRTAVLLAAGRGTRLGPLTDTTPKPLLEVAGAPIIARIIDSLVAAGIANVIVVAGYLADQMERFGADFARTHPSVKISVVRQQRLNGTGGAMLAARPLLAGESRFIFGWGDILMSREFYKRFADQARTAQYDLLMAVNRVQDPSVGAAVYVDAHMRVTRMVEKPPRGTSETNWNNAGLFASGPVLFDYLGRLKPSQRGELELPAAIAAMIAAGLLVRAVEVRGFWSDVGTPDDLIEARRAFARRMHES